LFPTVRSGCKNLAFLVWYHGNFFTNLRLKVGEQFSYYAHSQLVT
jgi:hypothetical protein